MKTETNAHSQVDRAERIAALNDGFRKALPNPGKPTATLTEGIVNKLGDLTTWPAWQRYASLLRTIREFSNFDTGNDPHGERDMGFFEWEDERCIWKFDYFDQSLTGHSPDAADPSATVRILTVMLAAEY